MADWISVKDRLPLPGEFVVALFPVNSIARLRYGADAVHNGHGESIEWQCVVRQLVPQSDPECRWADQGVTHWKPFSPPTQRE